MWPVGGRGAGFGHKLHGIPVLQAEVLFFQLGMCRTGFDAYFAGFTKGLPYMVVDI